MIGALRKCILVFFFRLFRSKQARKNERTGRERELRREENPSVYLIKIKIKIEIN